MCRPILVMTGCAHWAGTPDTNTQRAGKKLKNSQVGQTPEVARREVDDKNPESSKSPLPPQAKGDRGGRGK